MMIIQFNSLGVITSVDTSNASFRQGSKGEVIQAVFAGKSNSTHTAKINFTRPDGTVVQNLVMLPDPNNQSAFLFELDDLWFLAISGNATMTIFLYNASNVIQAQGQATIPIESSDYTDEDDVPITTEQYDSLLALVSSKVNNSSAVIVVNDIDDLDMTQFGVNQLFYVVSKNQFMQLVENESEEKELKVYDLVPGQQATMSIIANTLTNVNGRDLSAYESQIVIVNDFQCYKITRGGENLTEEYASRYMEFMTGSKYLPKYDYEHPQNTYFITPSGLILKPQYDSTNGLLLYPMSNLATKNYVDNDILEITDTATPLTYEQRQKILTNNVRIKYGNFYYEKMNHLGHNVIFERTDVLFNTNADGSTTISQHFIVIRDNTGSISTNTRELVTYSKAQADQIFANNVEMSVDSNYVLKVKLIDKNGEQLAEDSVDLPLENIVQSAQYYETYTYQGTTYEDVIVITLATTDVPTIIPVGDLVSGLVSENTFNQGMATKVDKTNVANKVYGTNGSGSQTTFDIDNNVSGNVVRRDSNSQIKVPLAPTSNDDATSKDYTDSFAKDVALSLDQSTYVLTVTLKNANGGNIVSRTVDLPLETMVVSGSYDETNKAIVLVLKNGQTISIPVSDLISGLVSTDYLQANYYNKTQINEMVSGFVFADVDDHLSPVSTNPVENRVVVQALEEKANVDGYYPTMSNGHSDSSASLDSNVGNHDETPIAYNSVGGNSDVTTGFQRLDKLVGCKLVQNQQLQSTDFSDYGSQYPKWSTPYQSVSVSNGVITLSRPNDNWSALRQTVPTLTVGHTYLIKLRAKADAECSILFGLGIGQQLGSSGVYAQLTLTTEWQDIIVIGTLTSNALGTGNGMWIMNSNGSLNERTVQYEKPRVHDITQLFGNQEVCNLVLGTAGTSLEKYGRLMKFVGGKLKEDYDAGSFTECKSAYLESTDYNVWDEEVEVGGISTTDGANVTNGNYYRSKNYTRVKSGVEYYVLAKDVNDLIYAFEYDINKNLIKYINFRGSSRTTLQPNTAYLRICNTERNTYQNNVSIFEYWDGSRIGYEPFERHLYPMPNVDLNGILTVKDGKVVADGNELYPDNTKNKKRYDIVDLGTLVWGYTSGYFYSNGISSLAKANGKLICSKYKKASSWQEDKTIQLLSNSQVCVFDSSYADAAAFKQAMSDVYLIYELAEEQELEAENFPANIYGDDFGHFRFLDVNQEEIEGLQGADFFYEANIAGFAESLGVRADWHSGNIVIQEERNADNLARDTVDSQLKEALGGTLRQLLAISQSVDFLETGVIDLGDVDYYKVDNTGLFMFSISDKADKVAKMICTKYKYTNGSGFETQNGCIGSINNDSYLKDCLIKDTSLASLDATQFKAAMKGVLVAYEKASS